MRRFLMRLFYFAIIYIVLIIVGLMMPATPRASKSLLYAISKKDSLLENSISPRIIFIGGSNLSFGLNSQIILDSLMMNPVNTAVHSSLGLKFMLENTVQFVKPGDILVLAPEYEHFYRTYEFASEELLRSVFEVDPSKRKLIGYAQFVGMIPFLPKYAFSRFRPREYLNLKESKFYSVKSFNRFGDTFTHWEYEKLDFEPFLINGEFNPRVLKEIREFEKKINRRGARMYVTFPACQETFVLGSYDRVKRVEEELRKQGFVLLGSPERYMFSDSLMFNTPYHLNKKGLDKRTFLFIEDMQQQIISEWLDAQEQLIPDEDLFFVSESGGEVSRP
jgi:hypothetical protein